MTTFDVHSQAGPQRECVNGREECVRGMRKEKSKKWRARQQVQGRIAFPIHGYHVTSPSFSAAMFVSETVAAPIDIYTLCIYIYIHVSPH